MITARTTRAGKRNDVRLRDPAGRVYNRTFTTKRAAERYEAQERADWSRSAWVDPRNGSVTLADWSTRWMTQRAELRDRTRRLYAGLLRLHILPTLGSSELGQLTPSQVRAWQATMRGPTGPGQSTSAKAYRLLRGMLTTAVIDEVILRNPCQVAGAGIERAPERPVATVAEVDALADAILPRYRAVVLLASWCGLRRGEVLGPRRRDVNFDARRVHIAQTMQQLADGIMITGPPKTAAGRRVVAIPPHVIADLTDHLTRFTGPDADALVFTEQNGGPVRPHVLQKATAPRRPPGSPICILTIFATAATRGPQPPEPRPGS